MRERWVHQKYEKTLWEDGDLDGKIEGLGLEEDSEFFGTDWYRYAETVYKEEGE